MSRNALRRRRTKRVKHQRKYVQTMGQHGYKQTLFWLRSEQDEAIKARAKVLSVPQTVVRIAVAEAGLRHLTTSDIIRAEHYHRTRVHHRGWNWPEILDKWRAWRLENQGWQKKRAYAKAS